MSPALLHAGRGAPPPGGAGFTAAAARDAAQRPGEPMRLTVAVPGCALALVVDRDADGRLLRIAAGERVYVDAREPGRWVFDGGFVEARCVELPGGLLRELRLRTARGEQRWTERHRWDAQGRLVDVDGVAVERDARGRVTACVDRASGAAWRYGYAGDDLCVVQTPRVLRQLTRDARGRPLAWRESGAGGTREGRLGYDADGARVPPRARPGGWVVDACGRLLALRDAAGRVRHTFLWDGWSCLGAIDGEPGAPLAAVYSLDPGGTPVRLCRRDGMRRLPRDAFGEGLLDARHAGETVPGLFGGAIDDDGWVHLPLRRLDPRRAAFDRPDPLHGEASDPRRAGGWTGPLAVELPAAGPYTVCRHDPVTLTDPTGAISDLWWLIPSALTWSLQNTIGSLLGMWLNLQFSPLGWIVSAIAGADPFDAEWIGGHNHDAFGLRADGWLSRVQPVAWTYQFLVNEEKASFTALDDARLFAPDAAFRPTLYASVLLCRPERDAGFLLRGARNGPNATMLADGGALADWSRCGGTAEPAIAGSLQPVFPAGGLHFSTVRRGVRRQRGDIVELAPAPGLVTGVAGTYAALSVPATGLALAAGVELLLADAAGALDVVRVLATDEAGAATVVQADPAPTRLAAGALRLQGLTAPAGTEPLAPVAGDARLLAAAGSLDYVPSASVLRLSRAGATVHVARVVALEARLTLDAPVPPAVGDGFVVRAAVASGSFGGRIGAAPTVWEVQSGPVPGVGAGVLVGAGAAALPAIVVAVAGPALTLDRDLSALGAAGTVLAWQQLAPAGELGRHAGAPEAAAQVSYAPLAPGAAPAAGVVWLQGAQAAARRVTGLAHDALVLEPPRSDASPDPYDATRWRLAPPDIAGVTAGTVQTVALSAPLPADARALHLLPFPGPAVAAGADVFTAATVTTLAAGNPAVVTATIGTTSLAGALRAGDVVVVTPAAGAPAVAVVRRLRLTVTLDRNLALGSGPIEAVLLARDPVDYPATRRDAFVVQLQVPVVGGARLDLPRFVPGERVRVGFTDGGPQQRHGRVDAVAGATLTLTDDAAIPAGASAITVTRLQVQDPGTGSARWALDGRVVAPNQVEFSVWNAADALAQPRLALLDAGAVHAVQLAAPPQALAIELDVAGGAAALAGTVRLAAPAAAPGATFASRFVADERALRLPTAAVAATIAPGNLAAIVPYVETAQRVAGELHPGSVRIPDDHENTALELTRRQALDDHELMHTVQSARLGPIMLVAFPLWAFELANDLTAAGGPAFSPYVAGTLADGVLTPSEAAGFAAGGTVQIAQNRRAVTATLDAAAGGGGFRLRDADRRALGAAGFADGAVQLRRPLGGTGADVLEWITNIGQLLTVGGLMNVLSLAGWGGLAAIVVQVVQAIRGAARSRVDAALAADGLTLTLPEGAALEGLQAGALVALKAGDAIVVRAVAALAGRTLTLGSAAPAPLPGREVELSVYSPGAALFGLRSHFPAAVPDADRPARLQLLPVGGATLTPALHDRIEVRSADGSAKRTLVTRVDGDTIEIEDAVLLRADQPNEFLVARIAAEDPSGWLDGWLLNELHLGWMQYLHDPWGQILYRSQPAAGDVAAQIFARSARYLFGTQSWMCCFLGYFWNDNAYQRANPHRSRMEQEASRRSGDTYCPLGSLHGDVAVVGDVARYWLTVSGGTRDGNGDTPDDLIVPARQDAPGVHLQPYATVTLPSALPFPMPAALHAPDAVNSTPAVPLTRAAARGYVPTDATLERSCGVHVAFSRPASPASPYRITGAGFDARTVGTPQNIPGLAESLDAQADGAATIFFDRPVADVAVTAAGAPVAEGATLQVLPFQRLRFGVAPAGERVWRVSAGGEGRTFDSADLTLTARGLLEADDVEISRVHRWNGTRYESGIGPLHLPADLDIAVRRVVVQVVDTLPLRASADVLAPAIASIAPGAEAFVLLPSPLAPVAGAVAVTVAGALPVAARLDPAATPLSPETVDFLGDGVALRWLASADEPPEETVRVAVTLQVGTPPAAALAVRCEFDLAPAFTLTSAGGFAVAAGGTLTLSASDGSALQALALPAGFTAAAAGADLVLTVAAGHAPGPATVRAADAADATRQARRIVTVT